MVHDPLVDVGEVARHRPEDSHMLGCVSKPYGSVPYVECGVVRGVWSTLYNLFLFYRIKATLFFQQKAVPDAFHSTGGRDRGGIGADGDH